MLVKPLEIDWSPLEPLAAGVWFRSCRACRFCRFVGPIGLGVGHGASTVDPARRWAVQCKRAHSRQKVSRGERALSTEECLIDGRDDVGELSATIICFRVNIPQCDMSLRLYVHASEAMLEC